MCLQLFSSEVLSGYNKHMITLPLLIATILAAFLLAVLVFTAEKWLLFILNRMDLALTKIGFGKWSARALTAAEEWFRKRRDRRNK